MPIELVMLDIFERVGMRSRVAYMWDSKTEDLGRTALEECDAEKLVWDSLLLGARNRVVG